MSASHAKASLSRLRRRWQEAPGPESRQYRGAYIRAYAFSSIWIRPLRLGFRKFVPCAHLIAAIRWGGGHHGKGSYCRSNTNGLHGYSLPSVSQMIQSPGPASIVPSSVRISHSAVLPGVTGTTIPVSMAALSHPGISENGGPSQVWPL